MLGDNLLTGSLPVEFSELHNLSALELYQNRFSGPIPPELGQLRNLDNHYYFPKEGFTYQDLVEAIGNFSAGAVIGKGACGIVYKAVMTDGKMIAVK
ncbi:hypothetical protein RHMOL_Rhmol01G0162500 [Rhododendron molle]|uniref:Uncharacterized protein n=1 Tax=Rhododendron molle TaxID=49168 RepID=A0ACC0Q3E6_RHOML|nr:hypothetical protein RHMOL_Rhmol01G0162500 [Rhododendron molle]